MCLIGTAISHNAQAQFKAGLRLGVNMSQASIKGGIEDILQSETSPGVFIGPTLEFRIPLIGVGVDISALYNNKIINLVEKNGKSLETATNYIEMPINVRWELSLAHIVGIYAATGPQVAWNLDNNIFGFFGDEDYKLNKSTLSWNLGCGVKLGGHLGIGYNYNIAIGSTAKITSSNLVEGIEYAADHYRIRNNTHQLHLTYYF